MCLDRLKTKEEKKEILKDMPKKSIVVYKVVNKCEGKYFPPCRYCDSYVEGLNKVPIFRRYISTCCPNYKGIFLDYKVGFHSFKYKNDAQKYSNHITLNTSTVIECQINQSWITEIGEQNLGAITYFGICFVTNKIIFPKYEE